MNRMARTNENQWVFHFNFNKKKRANIEINRENLLVDLLSKVHIYCNAENFLFSIE